MNIALFTKSWPRHNYNGHLQKTISLIQSLINLNNKLVVCSTQMNINLKQQIKQYPMQLIDINPNKISTSLNQLTKNQFKPNLFIFDSIQTEQLYSAFIYNRWNKIPRVITINQLKKLSKWRKNNYKLIPNVLVPNGGHLAPQKIEDIINIEQMRSIQRCDYVLAGNQYIYYLLNKCVYGNKQNINTNAKYLSLINYGYPMDQYYGEIAELGYRPFKNRQHFVYFGNFQKQTSRDYIYHLGNYIWPMIRSKLPEAQLHIYGTYEQQGITYQKLFNNIPKSPNLSKQSFKKMGIKIKGKLQQTLQLSQYKALLYPCINSTSLHMKVIQSWFVHLPVVTTPIGAQGLFLQSYDPQFTTPMKDNSSLIFSSQRIITKQQKQQSQKIYKYYHNNIVNNKNISGLTFGGSFNNFTYHDFVNSAIMMYTDQAYWNKCLENCHKIIKKNQNQNHISVVLKKALVNVQIAMYQGRGKGPYQQEWKRYTKSPEYIKKIRG